MLHISTDINIKNEYYINIKYLHFIQCQMIRVYSVRYHSLEVYINASVTKIGFIKPKSIFQDDGPIRIRTETNWRF